MTRAESGRVGGAPHQGGGGGQRGTLFQSGDGTRLERSGDAALCSPNTDLDLQSSGWFILKDHVDLSTEGGDQR